MGVPKANAEEIQREYKGNIKEIAIQNFEFSSRWGYLRQMQRKCKGNTKEL